ncbi:MAG: DegT/DnrJ/EryC1/StrS family aminotransferase [Patescibacteria group bacterium]
MKGKTLRVPYARAVYGKEEIAAVHEVLRDPEKIVAGARVRAFEAKIAALFGKRHGVMVNSGSSANLLALRLLNLPRGSEVITPVLTFSTTVAPIVELGLVPVFADVAGASYQIDVAQIPSLIAKRTRALMIPSLIGNLPDFAALRRLAKQHGLFFVEDSCDTLSGRFAGKPTGVYSDISTTSFYASHILTAAGGGGMLCVNNRALADRARVMANWGRTSTLFGSHEASEALAKRMAGRLDGRPYDAKFIFSELGYNLQATELQGAFGLAQLARLKTFAALRRRAFQTLYDFFRRYERLFVLPKEDPRAETAWLAFPLAVREGAGFSREELTKYLEKRNIQTRPIFSGNILKQPGFRRISARVRAAGYPEAERIMRNGFLIGAHQGLREAHLGHVTGCFTEFLRRH